MADGTIRVGTKIDFSGVKADIKAFEKELATIQKEADKLNAKEKEVRDRYNSEVEYDKQFPEEMSHREQIDEKYSKQLEPLIKDRETLNQKAQEYNALLEQANEKLQQQSALTQAGKELDGAVKTAGALDKIKTEEQYQSMLARTKAQMERISAEAEKIATKHGLSREQLLSNNAEYQRLSDLLTQLDSKQGKFKKTAGDSLKSAQKSTNSFGQSIKNGIKQIAKMGLAIFGVRSAFNAMRKAANAYLESNQQLKSQMDSLWNIAGQAIGPVIEWLIKGISTLVVWVNNLVQALGGVNLIAKANAAALKKQASATKAASASMAGFDEMNKLSDSSGSGSSSGSTGIFDTSLAGGVPQFLEDIKAKILEGDWYGAGKTVGEELSDGIKSLDWYSVGTTVGEIVGNAATFTIGVILGADPSALLTSITKFLSGLMDGLSQAIQDVAWEEVGGDIVEFIFQGILGYIMLTNPIAGMLALIFTPDGKQLTSSATELIGSIIGALLAAVLGAIAKVLEIGVAIWEGILSPFKDIDWGGTPGDIIAGLFSGILKALKGIGDWLYDNVWIPFSDGFKKAFGIHSPSKKMAEFGVNIIDGLYNGIVNNINKIKQACTDIWNAIKEKFSNVGTWFKDTFSNAWQKVKDVFSKGGKIFDGIKEGIASTFKTIVNGLIDGINKVIRTPFNSINSMLNTIRGVEVFGVPLFKNLWSYNPLSVPQIPKLALGGIVNRPGRGVPAIIGEAGAEAVLPLENNTEWMDVLADKIGGNVTIPIYMDGKKIATYVVDIQKKKAFALNGA